jgi:FMN phosphatase YigB (HAD superfamily)
VLWPEVALEAIPELARLSARKREEFHLRSMQLGRTLKLAGGAADCLRWLHRQGVLLGIASNSQAYTLRELSDVLQGDGLDLSMFDPEIRFWSFENGFSKPDPHVFRILTTRLALRGIRATETLVVGDRLDNDIAPAGVFGCQTWQLTSQHKLHTGSWRELLAWLKDGE